MFIIFIFSFLIIILTIPFSRIFFNNNQTNFYSYSKDLIYGIVFLSFLSIFLNFFVSLNIYINSLIPVLSLLFLIKYKKIFFNINFLTFAIILSIFITIFLIESNVYRPDAGLYHLPFIGILNSEKIIIGLSNIHFRYGHTSIIQYFSAINNNFIFSNNGIVFAQALIASSVTLNFVYQIYIYNKSKNFNFHFFYLLFVTIYIAYKMNRYSEFGNDAPAHFLVFYLISEILLSKDKQSNNKFIDQLFISLFIITNKLTLIPILIFNLIGINKINVKKIFFNKNIYILTFFLLIWLIKNILNTGCLIYPIKQVCFSKLIWTDLTTIEKVNIASEAWTKGISDIDSKNINLEKFNKRFNWINAWLSKHFYYILEVITPYIFFLLLIFLLIKFKSNRLKFKNYENYNTMIIFSFLTILIWFLKAPLYRYGYSLIIVFLSLIFANGLKVYDFEKKFLYKLSNLILILGIMAIVSKNIYRISTSNNEYFNYPWVKYYSMDINNEASKLSSKSFKNKRFTIPNMNYCMYTKSICAHYGLPDNLDIKKYFNYDVYFINK